MFFHVHARFAECDAFRFQEFALQTGIRLTDQQFTAIANHAMPGNAFPGGACRHGPAGTARSTPQAKGFGNPSIGNNPPAGNSFHEREHRSPGHVVSLSPFAHLQILHKELPILSKEAVAGSVPSPARVEMAGGVLNEHKAKTKHGRLREKENGIDETNETQRKK
jgi:hypothetical protein